MIKEEITDELKKQVFEIILKDLKPFLNTRITMHTISEIQALIDNRINDLMGLDEIPSNFGTIKIVQDKDFKSSLLLEYIPPRDLEAEKRLEEIAKRWAEEYKEYTGCRHCGCNCRS